MELTIITEIGADLSIELEKKLIDLLRENSELFAWSLSDMGGVSRDVMEHRLAVRPDKAFMKQKLRKLSTERSEVIKLEIAKLSEAGHIRGVWHPEWLANPVLVKKSNGKWRMCVDFTDLNKTCPKDDYHLPRIDQLVNSMEGCERLSFLDAYSGYHQVHMAK